MNRILVAVSISVLCLCARQARAGEYSGSDAGILLFSTASQGHREEPVMCFRRKDRSGVMQIGAKHTGFVTFKFDTDFTEGPITGSTVHAFDYDGYRIFYDDTPFEGRVTGISLEPGDYEIYRIDTFAINCKSDNKYQSDGFGNRYNSNFYIKIHIRSGVTTYIGEFKSLRVSGGKHSMFVPGGKIISGWRFAISDQNSRDLRIADAKGIPVSDSEILVPDGDALNSPILAARP